MVELWVVTKRIDLCMKRSQVVQASDASWAPAFLRVRVKVG